jgi:predicted transcriptional regulator of viral defense system
MIRREMYNNTDVSLTMTLNQQEKVLRLARRQRVLRPRDLATRGLPADYLWRLSQTQQLEKVGRGLYAWPGQGGTEHSTLVEAALRVPQGVVCLLSALRFHGLTTQEPCAVWIALDGKARRPTEELLPLRIVRFSGPALTEGVGHYPLEGVEVSIYTPAKTVADCFKYRHKIGLEVALEALREGLRQRAFSADELWHCARVCRVARVLRPYWEALA